MDDDFFLEGIENEQVEIVTDSSDSTDSFLFDDAGGAYGASQSTGDNAGNDYQIEVDHQEEALQEEEQQEAQQESMYTLDDIYDLIQVNTAAINSQSETIEKISTDLVIASKNQNLIDFVIMGVLIMFFAGFVTYLFLRKL